MLVEKEIISQRAIAAASFPHLLRSSLSFKNLLAKHNIKFLELLKHERWRLLSKRFLTPNCLRFNLEDQSHDSSTSLTFIKARRHLRHYIWNPLVISIKPSQPVRQVSSWGSSTISTCTLFNYWSLAKMLQAADGKSNKISSLCFFQPSHLILFPKKVKTMWVKFRNTQLWLQAPDERQDLLSVVCEVIVSPAPVWRYLLLSSTVVHTARVPSGWLVAWTPIRTWRICLCALQNKNNGKKEAK